MKLPAEVTEGFVYVQKEAIPVAKTVFSWGTRLIRRKEGVLGEYLEPESEVLNADKRRAFMLKEGGRVDLRPKKESKDEQTEESEWG